MKDQINGKDLLKVIDSLSFEKEISKDLVLSAVENALASCGRKEYGNYDIFVKIDPIKGNYDFYKRFLVVDDNYESFVNEKHIYEDIAQEKYGLQIKIGDYVEEKLEDKNLGRVSAHYFKQSIKENITKVKRISNAKKYANRVGDLFSLTVKKVVNGDIFVSLNEDVEGIIPKSETIQGEWFKNGFQVNAVLLEVSSSYKGMPLIFSRASTEYVNAVLFKEVPDISEENIVIHKIVRLAGYKTKVALEGRVPHINPVRECIGPKKIRLESIQKLLGHENIEFIEYKKDLNEFIVELFKPFALSNIYINEQVKELTVSVNTDILNKVIGTDSINVNLIEKIIGYKIHVLSKDDYDTKFSGYSDNVISLFESALNIDNDFAVTLYEEGFEDIESIAYCKNEDLLSIEGLTLDIAKLIRENALIHLKEISFENAKELMKIDFVSEEIAGALVSNNIFDKNSLADLSTDELLDLIDIERSLAEKIIIASRT